MKYSKLWDYIVSSSKKVIVLVFREIENILGFKIDHSFLNSKKELINYGYEVSKISLKNKEIYVRRINNEKNNWSKKLK